MIAVPQIAVNIAPAKTLPSASPLSGSASGKTFSQALQDASHAEANPASGRANDVPSGNTKPAVRSDRSSSGSHSQNDNAASSSQSAANPKPNLPNNEHQSNVLPVASLISIPAAPVQNPSFVNAIEAKTEESGTSGNITGNAPSAGGPGSSSVVDNSCAAGNSQAATLSAAPNTATASTSATDSDGDELSAEPGQAMPQQTAALPAAVPADPVQVAEPGSKNNLPAAVTKAPPKLVDAPATQSLSPMLAQPKKTAPVPPASTSATQSSKTPDINAAANPSQNAVPNPSTEAKPSVTGMQPIHTVEHASTSIIKDKDQLTSLQDVSTIAVPEGVHVTVQPLPPAVQKAAPSSQAGVNAVAKAPASTSDASANALKEQTDTGAQSNAQSDTQKGSATFSVNVPANGQGVNNDTSAPVKAEDATPAANATVAAVTAPIAKAENPAAPAKAEAHTDPAHAAAAASVDESAAPGAMAYPGSLIHSAKLVERMGQAELRVGIQTGEFGNVDIRTSMVRNQFTAQISVERGELSKVLAAELPSLQNRLSEQRMPSANIILQNQSGGGSAGSGQGSRQSRSMPQIAIPNSLEVASVSTVAAASPEAVSSSARLDVHI